MVVLGNDGEVTPVFAAVASNMLENMHWNRNNKLVKSSTYVGGPSISYTSRAELGFAILANR